MLLVVLYVGRVKTGQGSSWRRWLKKARSFGEKRGKDDFLESSDRNSEG